MMGLLAIPSMILRVMFGIGLWLMFRPGGWAVVCVLALVATEYYADFF